MHDFLFPDDLDKIKPKNEPYKMKQKLLISFSGGRISAYMTKWLLENKQQEYEMIVVFANTGKEREETLEFVERCDKYFGFNVVWVEAAINPEHRKGTGAKVVSFASASRNGEPFEAMIQKYGLPNKAFPHCTRELKTRAIQAYAKSIGWTEYYTAIGIRADEFDRVSDKREEQRLLYPLVSWIPTRKSDVNLFWSKQFFDLELKSYEGNCNKCFKKALRKLLTIEKEEQVQGRTDTWWHDMEQKYGEYVPATRRRNSDLKLPIRFYRNNMSAAQITQLSKQPFEPARDESKDVDRYKQTSLFGLELDVTNGCEESCEAF